ncbi:unnamed protein product [Mytilus edulis]|uniref:WSC domain-containing protein n=1 Tax=Mytilus edulis TaxID=6550 RepID=A0A8S3RDE6_MYTED|nr:unnamed protein product [Mytilus edulis]
MVRLFKSIHINEIYNDDKAAAEVSDTCQIQVIGSHDYVGCFVDTLHTRLLPHTYVLDIGTINPLDMENNLCFLCCKEQGYKYCGTQNRDECHCGDDPYQYGPADVRDYYIQDFDCDRECTGDSKQMCGGGWRLSVYETGYVQTKQGRVQLKLVSINTMIIAPPNQVITARSKIECARYCKLSDDCKVFVMSIETGECSLYNSYTVMCEGLPYVQGFHVYLIK